MTVETVGAKGYLSVDVLVTADPMSLKQKSTEEHRLFDMKIGLTHIDAISHACD